MNKFNLKKYLSEGRLFQETTEKASDRLEDKLKEKYASELGVEKEEIKFVDHQTAADIQIPDLKETAIEDVCNSIIKLLGRTIRIIPEIASQDKLENFLTAVIEDDADGIYRVTKNYSEAGIDPETGNPTVFWKKITWKFMALVIDAVVLVAKAGCWAGDFPFKVALLVINKYGPGTEGFPKDKN